MILREKNQKKSGISKRKCILESGRHPVNIYLAFFKTSIWRPAQHRGATRTIRNHPETKPVLPEFSSLPRRSPSATAPEPNRPGTGPHLNFPDRPRRNVPEFCCPCEGGRSLTMIFSDGFGIQFDVFYAAAMVVAPCLSVEAWRAFPRKKLQNIA